MKALVYTGPKSIEYCDVPDPSPGDGDVLIRVESVGICGSDMHAYLGHDERRPAPLILGHEAAGTVVSELQKGRRVTVNPLVTCRECEACRAGRENLCPGRQIVSMPPREGAFAQYVAMPERNLVTVPDDVPFSKAALAEPIACGWHGVKLAEKSLMKPLRDIAALVIGGGAIGVGAALSLKARGVRDVLVVDANEGRRNFLPDRTGLDVRAPAMVASRDDFDLVVDGVGFAATRNDASLRVKPGGTIVHIGLGEATDGLNVRRMTLQEITFIGTYTYTDADFRETAQAIFDGRLGSLDWIEELSLVDGANAFAELLAGRVRAPKIILNPPQD
jgi:L-iditol 2-dehydrogenase